MTIDHAPERAALKGFPAGQRDLVGRYLNGELSAEMTLMYWLQATPSRDEIQAVLRAGIAAGEAAGLPREQQLLHVLANLANANESGCDHIAGMLRSGVDNSKPAPNVEEGIAFCQRLFDWSVEECAEASVALYSLGNPAILTAATAEIVQLMTQWKLVGKTRKVLEIGCGIGRFQKALAPRVLAATGIDVSANMIRAARERCAGCANVVLQQCTGRDLTMFDSASFDLVFAVDCFPYLVQSGMPLVEKHFSEVWRVLKPGGDFLILELSYHRDLAIDQQDIVRLARGAFDILVNGSRPFKLWDGAAFHLRARARRFRPAD